MSVNKCSYKIGFFEKKVLSTLMCFRKPPFSFYRKRIKTFASTPSTITRKYIHTITRKRIRKYLFYFPRLVHTKTLDLRFVSVFELKPSVFVRSQLRRQTSILKTFTLDSWRAFSKPLFSLTDIHIRFRSY